MNSFQKHPKGYLIGYTLIILCILLVVAYLYIESITKLQEQTWRRDVLISIWFALLGTVAINIKGIIDHRKESNKIFHKWDLWYLVRPASGIIVGIMTYALLWAASNHSPSLPILIVIAFLFGMQEKMFSQFLYKIADLILTSSSNSKNKKNKK